MIQSAPTWADAEASLARVEQMIAVAPTADVYVLPEMFATGFCMQPERIAQPEGGTILSAMKRLSAHYGAAIVGSVAVADGGKSYNRMYFVRPDGTVDRYDKRHLFTYSGEHAMHSGIPRRALLAASVLRPAFPRVVAQPRRLRRHHLRCKLARGAHFGVGCATSGACHRKSMLRRGRKPHRRRPGVLV